MKKLLLVMLVLGLTLALIFVIVGCGSDESPTPGDSEEMQATNAGEGAQMPDEDMETQMPSDTMMTSGYIDVSPKEAKELIDTNPDLIVIDVSPHYAEGHLPRAVNYYLDDGSLDAAIPSLDKNAEYLVYCHVDSVSIAGAQKLIDAGFTKVYRLQGNYSAWVQAGYPVEVGT